MTEVLKENIALVILCYNSADEIEELLINLEIFEKNYFVIVVDNASKQTEIEKLRRMSIDHLILLKDNNGYAAGNNVGIKYAKEQGYEYIAVMNSDIEFIEKDTLQRLKNKLVEFQADFVGPKMKNQSGYIVSGNVITNKYGDCFFGEMEKTGIVESITGALFLFQTSVLNKVGYMNEDFFLYREETEYLIRATRLGAKIIYVPEISIVHKCGSTTGTQSYYYLVRNGICIARNLYHTPQILIIFYYIKKYWKSIIKVMLHYHIKIYDRNIVMGIKDGMKGVKGKKVL